MKFFRAFIWILIFSASLKAQLVLDYSSQPRNPGDYTKGQSFRPGDAGSFPTSSAYLTQFTFVGAGSSSSLYLSIYSDSLPLGSSPSYAGFVGTSTNAIAFSYNDTEVFNFDHLALDKNTTYYALLSGASGAGQSVVSTPFMYANPSSYPGGELAYQTGTLPGLDAVFSASFSTSAVPEPSTYTGIAGLAALGFAVLRRRKKQAS